MFGKKRNPSREAAEAITIEVTPPDAEEEAAATTPAESVSSASPVRNGGGGQQLPGKNDVDVAHEVGP